MSIIPSAQANIVEEQIDKYKNNLLDKLNLINDNFLNYYIFYYLQ